MAFAGQILKNLMTGLVLSPVTTVGEIGRRLLLSLKVPDQVVRLREMTSATPLILQVETINTCNASCIFCAYPSMKRKKGVMDMSLFEKIVKDYAAMGGGPVSLTPVVGDALLDPHLMERLRILKAHAEINQVSLTTNAIALERYSDENVLHLLESLYCIQVSIGGLDASTYKMLYGVDRFPQVRQSVDRLLKLRETLPQPANITLAFRTNDWRFEKRFRQQLDEYRQRGVYINSISDYANYSGLITNDKERNISVLRNRGKKHIACIYPSVAMSICRDGTITACGCVDYEGNKLTIGHAEKETLSEVWSGKRRRSLLDSFGKMKAPLFCRQCSAYQPDTIAFSRPYYRVITPHRPLPLEFFHEFWGG